MFFKLLIKPQVPVWRKRRGRRPLLRALLTKRLEAQREKSVALRVMDMLTKRLETQRKKSVALRVKGHVDKKVACTNYFSNN